MDEPKCLTVSSDISENGDKDEGSNVQKVGFEIGGYTVLPDVTKTKVEKVKRKLPAWLESPDVVESDIANKQKPLDSVSFISDRIRAQLKHNQITHLFPVQWQVIPEILSSVIPNSLMSKLGLPPRDICCSAPTGSGKTLAFSLPVIQLLETCNTRRLRALVVLPVSDLALQVYKVFQDYSEGTSLKVALTNGQLSLAEEQKMLTTRNDVTEELETAVDILVTTPGRLVDHISFTQGFDLTQLRFLILDEVDKILEEVKHDWLDYLERAVYDKRGWPQPITAASLNSAALPLQKLLFSATLTQNPEKLEKLRLCEPRLFTSVISKEQSMDVDHSDDHFTGKYTTPQGLQEYYIECRVPNKQTPSTPISVTYTKTEESTCVCWISGHSSEVSGDISKKRRTQIIRQFSRSHIDVIITTDLMARGLDVDDVSTVVSYDSPPYIKTYIHRVGRTARAGKPGQAYTILNAKEVSYFRKMIKSSSKSVKARKVGRSELAPYVERCKQILSAKE
ncbi:DDX51 [Bugula neritina]|uniref:ATP-dependent RNA helicase n=1 Tax=Bugula neritina TaxID=10212 RepID=A0A7J7J0N3_BUGNE|nr:DDX51 [Bugula neritina]